MDPTWWSTSCDGETSHEPLTYETDIDIDELDLDYFLAESAAGIELFNFLLAFWKSCSGLLCCEADYDTSFIHSRASRRL